MPHHPPPHPGPKYHHPIKYEPRPYAYSYGVEDDYHGVKFGQNEESDGKVVHGSYHVLLPDGRIRNVKYTADHYAGYIADVSYTNPHKPIVHHKPAPYHPEPAYDGPAVYQYGYAVADDYSGANFAANENRDGYATNGEYRVNLPDGRTQIVTYSVGDAYSGYVADVKYEGVAQYPEYHPAPAYKPAPYHA